MRDRDQTRLEAVVSGVVIALVFGAAWGWSAARYAWASLRKCDRA